MSFSERPQAIKANAHPEAELEQGEHPMIPHPPPEDYRPNFKPIPDTGWRGQPDVSSRDGGDSESEFLNKPPYIWQSKGNLFQAKYTSSCWCGNLAFEFHGNTVDAKHCHCRQCQRLHGAPFQWAVIFPKTSVRMTRNIDDSLHFFSTETRTGEHFVPCKVSCNQCRAPMFDEGRQTILAYPGSFKFRDGKVPRDFQPTAHIFYSERVMDVPDGVPKWSGHKGKSELMQEMSADEGIMPRYKGSQDTSHQKTHNTEGNNETR